jgi:hypothetical protein
MGKKINKITLAYELMNKSKNKFDLFYYLQLLYALRELPFKLYQPSHEEIMENFPKY